MRKLVVGLMLSFSGCDMAYALDLVNAQFEVGKHYNYRDPLMPKYTLLQESHRDEEYGTNEAWAHQIGLLLDTDLVRTGAGYAYFDQAVIANSTTHQYRRVFWDWELGMSSPLQGMQVFWSHRSEHAMDTGTEQKYPIKDVYGIRICLLGAGCKR